MTLDIPTDAPVLVTGATGYVAGHVVRRLLEEGATVHATVRDASNTERLQYLRDLEASSPGTLRLFSADLLDTGSFADAMAGCSVVLHIASPFALDVDDPQRDLVDPAVDGTRNVLTSVDATESVQRVVLTSSCAAIYGDNTDVQHAPGGVLTEDVWNTTSTLEHGAYSLSKTLAEKEAWRLADAQDRWRLVVINPSMVFGPGTRVHGSSESFQLITQIADGTFASGAPDLRIGVVDVREVAEAHLRAAFLPQAQGRHILSGSDTSVPEIVNALRPRFGERLKLPARTLPKCLLWLVGPLVNSALTRRFVSRNIGVPFRADNSKSRESLGITYRPLAETVGDHVQQLIDQGVVAV